MPRYVSYRDGIKQGRNRKCTQEAKHTSTSHSRRMRLTVNYGSLKNDVELLQRSLGANACGHLTSLTLMDALISTASNRPCDLASFCTDHHRPFKSSTVVQIHSSSIIREWPPDVVAYSRRLCRVGTGVSNSEAHQRHSGGRTFCRSA